MYCIHVIIVKTIPGFILILYINYWLNLLIIAAICTKKYAVNYLNQGGCVCGSVGLFVCLYVSMLAILLTNYEQIAMKL